MKVDTDAVEEIAKTLYIQALKVLPDDIKEGFQRLDANETDATGKAVLATMIENIEVAEGTDNLLCQDTGLPIYNVTIGRGVEVDGYALKEAIRRGVERATARVSAAVFRRSPDHADERAHLLRARGAGHLPRLQRAAG